MTDVEREDRPERDDVSELRTRLEILAEPLSPFCPAERDRHAVAARVLKAQLECEGHCALWIVGRHVDPERALQEIDVRIEVEEPHGGERGPLEIVDREGRAGIGLAKDVERGLPIGAIDRRPCVEQQSVAVAVSQGLRL